MLNVHAISRSYGDFKAVDDVSFDVGQGEVVGLLGHNGAGKTTVMKMLSGYLEPDMGTIEFKGRQVTSEPLSLQQQLGYLPEHLPVYPELSVASYLDYAAELKGLKAGEKRREIRLAIEATELAEKLLSPIGTLSRGLKQRVGVAQAILGSPSLLILDEPTNGLDPGQTESMRRLIRTISERATVILSTHIMQEVEAVCDRALIIRQGQLVVDRKLDELTDNHLVRLRSSASDEQVRNALQSVGSIGAIKSIADATGEKAGQWSIQMDSKVDLSTAIAACTEQLVGHEVPVMGITAENRDLQTLFLEVSSTPATETSSTKNEISAGDMKEVSHVA